MSPSPKPKRRRRRKLCIPKELRKDITQHVRYLRKKYRPLFLGDRTLKERVLLLERALLPPRPRRRGRPGNETVTRAIALGRKFRRQYPGEKPRENLGRVCHALFPEYDTLPEVEQRILCDDLREGMRSRLRTRTRRNSC
jgi:hypothetical protein